MPESYLGASRLELPIDWHPTASTSPPPAEGLEFPSAQSWLLRPSGSKPADGRLLALMRSLSLPFIYNENK